MMTTEPCSKHRAYQNYPPVKKIRYLDPPETSPQIMPLLGFKGYALIKLGNFIESVPFLEESRSMSDELEQQAEKKTSNVR